MNASRANSKLIKDVMFGMGEAYACRNKKLTYWRSFEFQVMWLEGEFTSCKEAEQAIANKLNVVGANYFDVQVEGSPTIRDGYTLFFSIKILSKVI